ncbi:transposase [Chryseobacterium culicis]|uniref:Transposase n=1 Tax=Chryseobacterium culicis TaxID=680127 RepID=A0A1H6H3E8_CHRCI|nr:transposase [Chryseobacterium culicis]SEH29792.1 hypothetical protein SAMN05421593_1182 [Chryseobacterium culicis]
MKPDYGLIYSDIIRNKYQDKMKKYEFVSKKKKWSALDIIKINNMIFGTQDYASQQKNRKHHSYSESDILEILQYQKKHKISNSHLASHFHLSRNSVAKWKKIFYDSI